ncbi:hypothetical protein PGTUg99_023912 [Puccinia graminis f. sp. tritici]|uniref:Uncharacterized protein n=1 Tax=Puccinia graminis f. sp. tritici TaxID=56615 RepID=A0A5B0RJR7_PUCGR|nr:hypothetical protein PGTUg99_023912 [Puccinia graminis f. sp. tritici]
MASSTRHSHPALQPFLNQYWLFGTDSPRLGLYISPIATAGPPLLDQYIKDASSQTAPCIHLPTRHADPIDLPPIKPTAPTPSHPTQSTHSRKPACPPSEPPTTHLS